MQAATMTDRTLQIDGMHGDACVQKVTGALKDMPGVTTRSVKVGSAQINSDQAGSDAAIAGIGKAGYKSHESGASTDRAPATAAAPAAAPAPERRDAPAPVAKDAVRNETGHPSADKHAASQKPADRPTSSASPMKPATH